MTPRSPMPSLHRCRVEVLPPVILHAWLELGAGNDVRSFRCTKAVQQLLGSRRRLGETARARYASRLGWIGHLTAVLAPRGKGESETPKRESSFSGPKVQGEPRMRCLRCENRLQLRKRNGGSKPGVTSRAQLDSSRAGGFFWEESSDSLPKPRAEIMAIAKNTAFFPNGPKKSHCTVQAR